MRKINTIVIHCAATPNGRPVTVDQIDEWHAARGFKRSAHAMQHLNPHLSSIGYHYVVYVNGMVEQGRDIEEIGAHVAGSNARSIGICMVGTDKFTEAQWNALAALKKTMQSLFPDAEFKGHRDYSPDKDGDGVVEPWEWTKTCPGFDVTEWMQAGIPKEENVLR